MPRYIIRIRSEKIWEAEVEAPSMDRASDIMRNMLTVIRTDQIIQIPYRHDAKFTNASVNLKEA